MRTSRDLFKKQLQNQWNYQSSRNNCGNLVQVSQSQVVSIMNLINKCPYSTGFDWYVQQLLDVQHMQFFFANRKLIYIQFFLQKLVELTMASTIFRDEDSHQDIPDNIDDIELKLYHSYHPSRDFSNTNNRQKTNTYLQIMTTKENGKNMSKNMGNAFKKYINSQFQDPHLKRRYKIKPPQKVLDFCNKKKKGKQSMYNLNDFKLLFNDPDSNKLIQFFMEHIYFLDLLWSPKIQDPVARLPFIENFLSATRHPDKFIGNRTDAIYQATTKQSKKNLKFEEKQLGLHIELD